MPAIIRDRIQNMKRYSLLISLSIVLTFCSCSNGQNTSPDITKATKPDSLINTYKFIEPNISVSYDSNFFKITQRYSNTFYETESYDFSYQGDTAKKATIHIKAGHPVEYPPKKERDSLILAGIEEIKNTVNDTFSIANIDKQIRDINDFSCVGLVGYDKRNKKYSTLIECYHFSDNDNTEVIYVSKGNDLEMEYQLLTTFLSGINSHSQKEMDTEDSLIKNKYTVAVTPTTTVIDNFKYRPMTYIGVVAVNQKLEHKISEVRLNGSLGQEIFSPNESGQVPILSNDSEKGTITKNGELVLFNSFGKKVKLPFTFTYNNKGKL